MSVRVTARLLPFAMSVLLIAAAPVPPENAPAHALSPNEIVAAAPASDWVDIAPADLLVMDLAADRDGHARRVVIELMPPPFSQGWIGNIRKLAAAHWWDGTSVNRVQDNYVVQWGDANGEDKAKAKPLPPGLAKVPQRDFSYPPEASDFRFGRWGWEAGEASPSFEPTLAFRGTSPGFADSFHKGFPFSSTLSPHYSYDFPIHCYAMVGVGRDLPPDTGTGAELYTVIGTPPRHLDRNIALVGRVIAGIEHLSSLPRGTGALGFYEKPEQRVPIMSVRLGTEIAGLKRYQYLSTESASFARYTDARANRRDAFFIQPAGGVDICNVPVPIRTKP